MRERFLSIAAILSAVFLAPAATAQGTTPAMKSTPSVSNGWLAQRLQMGEPASASQFVRRWLFDDERRKAAERLAVAGRR